MAPLTPHTLPQSFHQINDIVVSGLGGRFDFFALVLFA
jgi:hypothetical protein